MNPKQNALRIIRFDHPEYLMTAPPVHGIAWRGCNHEGYEGGGHDCPVGTVWTDVWGTVWRKEQEGVMGFPVRHPIGDAAALARYRWPDPDDERICGRIDDDAKQADPEGTFLSGSHRETLWEKSYMLCGMETMMSAIFNDPPFAREVLHRVMDFQLGIARHYVDAGVELVGMGDDLGTQRGPLLGPRIVEAFLVPQYRRLFDFYKPRGVLIGFHSCGCIESVLDTFMDLGVDVLNPVQATANDLDLVRGKTQGKMALAGAVSSALIVEGPSERIQAAVRKRLWQLGREGGYFCGPDQGMPWPEAHIQALHDAVEKSGRYPLTDPDA
jgi:uroporphyrinogen decarboxylase